MTQMLQSERDAQALPDKESVNNSTHKLQRALHAFMTEFMSLVLLFLRELPAL
jgi:hypothetical protein